MCVVSMVHDYGRTNFPPVETWTLKDSLQYAEIIKRLDKLDKRFDQRDCEDESKRQYLQEVLDHIKELKAEISRKKRRKVTKKRRSVSMTECPKCRIEHGRWVLCKRHQSHTFLESR